MCRYTIAIDDTVIEQAKHAFDTESDIEPWLQRQMEQALIRLALTTQRDKKDGQQAEQRIRTLAAADPGTVSFRDLKGILPASSLSPEELRDNTTRQQQIRFDSGY